MIKTVGSPDGFYVVYNHVAQGVYNHIAQV